MGFIPNAVALAASGRRRDKDLATGDFGYDIFLGFGLGHF